MIHADLDIDMPTSCAVCPFRKVVNDRNYCSFRTVYLGDDCLVRRPFWCNLQETQPKRMLHFKTELCDGHIHMTANDFVEHGVRENREKQRMKLKKLANNPALSDDVREMLNLQLFYINEGESWRNAYIALRQKYDKLRKETGRKY